MYELGGPLDGVRVPPGTNLLVVGRPLTGKRSLGFDLLADGAERDERGVVVTTTDSAPRVRDRMNRRLAGTDAPVDVVDCVSKHQGITTVEGVTYASAPDDLTGVGIALSEHLDPDGDRATRTLLSSLSPLLVYSNRQTVFRFMHVFTTRVENASALGVHLLEEGVHDEEVAGTFDQLFDGVVRTRADAPPTVETLPPGAETT